MNGETELEQLLKKLQPELNPGEYVFCTVNTPAQAAERDPISIFKESEEVTVILPKNKAHVRKFIRRCRRLG